MAGEPECPTGLPIRQSICALVNKDGSSSGGNSSGDQGGSGSGDGGLDENPLG